MSNFCIYLKVEPYLAQWVTNHLGDPIDFPRDSPESKLIKRFLDKTPLQDNPDLDGNVKVLIPYSKQKDPRFYNYLRPMAKSLLVESLESMFITNLWAELGSVQGVSCSLTSLIRAWLEQHGISEDYEETIRQKFYRIRKRYQKKGIFLGKTDKNRSDFTPDLEQMRTI